MHSFKSADQLLEKAEALATVILSLAGRSIKTAFIPGRYSGSCFIGLKPLFA
jgi:hypothetical protein